ncbi:MAG: head-tail adaptor protein, partial [Rhodobacteraceae bacterium]|nr:head-tail adaptor protein [Paracoccaceae bacterium]
MRPPVLSRPLVLEARARVADGAGGFVETWEARGTLWAEVAPGAGTAA